MSDTQMMEEIAVLKNALSRALRAICLTRDYVGEETLPAKVGWEWVDAGDMIAELLPDDEWVHQFYQRRYPRMDIEVPDASNLPMDDDGVVFCTKTGAIFVGYYKAQERSFFTEGRRYTWGAVKWWALVPTGELSAMQRQAIDAPIDPMFLNTWRQRLS